MSAEQQPKRAFEFTEREELHDRISDARFRAMLADERTTIHSIALDTNNYGEFLFVTVSRPTDDETQSVTFWGLGFHEYRERWLTNQWRWYESTLHPKFREVHLEKDAALKVIEERRIDIGPDVGSQPSQSKRAQLFELLADLTDEDGAYMELEDFGDDLLDDAEI